MLFTTAHFLLFFAIYYLVNLSLRPRARIALIIAGGAFFYGWWNPAFLWIPCCLIASGYLGARWIEASATSAARFARLTVTVISILLPLLVYKYANFLFVDVLRPVLHLEHAVVHAGLPLGISFITFTVIAYVVDVHRGRYPLEKRPAKLAALVLFFPHLIAGPILRPSELLPQLGRRLRGFGIRIPFGLAILSIGFLKKKVFADPMGQLIDPVFAAPDAASGFQCLLAIYGYSLQAYTDFSGYTDMAIGLAILLGIRLPPNFHRPYLSASPAEFWRRWHLTLSRWLRDYLYIPLGGNRRGTRRQALAVTTTMLVGGLWHGASWTFVLWGALWGIAITLTHAMGRRRARCGAPPLYRPLSVFLTFHFVALTFVLFRAPAIGQALAVLRGALRVAPGALLAPDASVFAFPLLLLLVFFATHAFDEHRKIRRAVQFAPPAVLWPALAGIWALVLTLGAATSTKFIYFDF